MFEEDVERFKNREIKANSIFYIKQINKNIAYDFVRKYHYLGNAKFFSVYSFGLFYKPTTELVGVATFSLPQGAQTLAGWFGLGNDTKNILELTRLCLLPCLNNTNASSFLLGGSIKKFNEMNNEARQRCKISNTPFTDNDWVCRAVITLALAQRHAGSIYQVCNFKYYGLTAQKQSFYDEVYGENARVSTSIRHGAWLMRPRKHRYAYILDKSLKCLFKEEERPKKDDLREAVPCCGGKGLVYDNRYDEWWTCPVCTGKLELVDKDGNKLSNPRILGERIKEIKKDYNNSLQKFSFSDIL